jgi:hypothetical protein
MRASGPLSVRVLREQQSVAALVEALFYAATRLSAVYALE